MRLEDLSVTLRPRGPWEAIDLGLVLVRRYARAIYVPWFALLVPWMVALNLIFQESPWFALLAFWWFKPLYDRLVLHVLARAVFGNPPTAGETLRALPSLLKTGLLAHLTVLRVDLARAFNLPVWQLEGLRRRERRARQGVLQLRARSQAVWLMITCAHLEVVVNLSLYVLIAMLIPSGVDFDFLGPVFSEDEPLWAEFLSNTFYLLTVSVIEPLYVAAGFTLYLNRRTQIEGWDLELAFRRMAARLEALGRGGAAALLACVLLGAGVLAPAPVHAALTAASEEPLSEARLPPERAHEVIAKVLAQEEFQTEDSIELWLPKEKATETPELEGSLEWLQTLAAAVARIAEVLLWLALGFAVALLILYRERWLRLFVRSRRIEGYRPPAALFGLDLRPESLPADVAGEARALLARGERRAALGLLYRASLAELVGHRGVELHESHTEGDVLRLARPRLGVGTLEFLTRLTNAWQLVAYAHRLPSPEEAAALCDDWQREFGPREEVPA